jgi:hypothetical protein
VNATTTRAGSRRLLGLLAAIGLAGALAMPAFAASVEPTFVDGNPDCASQGYSAELKIDAGALTGGATETFSNAFGTIDITSNAGLTEFSFDNAAPPVDAVIVKAGDGANVYAYDPAAEADSGLITPDNDGGQQAQVSHISVCFGEEPDEASPSEEGSPSEQPSPTGEVEGGNPTATPDPTLPDTGVTRTHQVPAAALSLVLVAALAALGAMRLARDR